VIDYDQVYGKVIASFPDSFVANFLSNQVKKVHNAHCLFYDGFTYIYEYDTCRWVFYYSYTFTGVELVQCDVRRFDD